MTLLIGRRRLMTVAMAAMAALMLAESAVLAATFVRGGPLKTGKVASAQEFFFTESLGPVDLPGMSLTVPVPSGEKGIFLVTFSSAGTCVANSDVACLVQVTMDGNVMVPGEVAWTYGHQATTASETRSMQWLAGPVGSGNHNFKVRVHVGGTGTFYVLSSTLSVLRMKG